jgi:hypothetical protein
MLQQKSTKENPIYYVYFSYEEWGLGYIGQRTCPPGLTIEEDYKYMGSFSHPTYKPTEKIILAVFSEHEKALDLEIALHRAYRVADNPHFANLAEQRSNKMKAAKVKSPSTCKKLSEINKGEKNPNYGRRGKDHWHYGKKWTEEQKQKISDGLKGRVLSPESISKISESNKKTKRQKSTKYDWINKVTKEKEDQKSVLEIAEKYNLGERILRRCAKGLTKCSNTDWITKTQAEILFSEGLETMDEIIPHQLPAPNMV